ncbi:NAD-P-binding protein [Peniophora sp. CONT]|nr:NAD-P-binding protein [Peniophora sp. CONT]
MGQHLSLLDQWFPPRPRWSVADIPDLTGKVALVTGGNAGIGRELVKQLLTRNATVYLAARSETKAMLAINELEVETGHRARFVQLDLADISAVRAAAAGFLAKENELHFLFANGGVMWPAQKELTADGLDLQFGTNVAGHYALIKLLLPALRAASKTTDKARVAVTSSMAAYLGTLRFGSFEAGEMRDKMTTYELYAQSKHGSVVLAKELTRRYGDVLTVTSCNPGNLRTELQRNVPQPLRWLLQYGLLYPVPYGALTPLYAGVAPETADANGKFFVPWARTGECRPEASDPEAGAKLWSWLERVTGV